MPNLIKRFVKDESGATAIEYGLIAGLISIVIITTVTLAGSKLEHVFDKIGTTLDSALTK